MLVLLGLIALVFLAVFNAVPLAFFAMLFFGNLGFHLSFLAVLPGAVAIKFIANNLASAPVVRT